MLSYSRAVSVLSSATLLVGCALLAGCGGGDGGAELPDGNVAVSGIITLDGAPLDRAAVTFFNPGDPLASGIGVTDVEGRYTLRQGAKPGDTYRVRISKVEAKEVNPEDPEFAADPAAAEAGEELIPEKYSSRDNTELELKIPEGGTDAANFDLTSN